MEELLLPLLQLFDPSTNTHYLLTTFKHNETQTAVCSRLLSITGNLCIVFLARNQKNDYLFAIAVTD